nr:HAMP domain-containing methyl-accepting chemotaxis protein [Bacillus coahuilensis]
MKLTTLIKTTAAITTVLFLLTAGSIFILFMNLSDLEQANKVQLESRTLSHQLQNASDYLTNEVRAYTQFGEQKHYDNYWTEVNDTKTRDRVVSSLEELNVPTDLLALIQEASDNSNDLVIIEEKAMAEVEKGNLVLARSLVYGDGYELGKEAISEPIKEFDQKLEAWTEIQVRDAATAVAFNFTIVIVASILVFISIMTTFIMLFRKIKPLARLANLAEEISNGNLTGELYTVKSKDEIAHLTLSFNRMAENLRSLLSTVKKAGENVAVSSEQLLSSAEQTNLATQQVASSIDEIASGADKQLLQVQESTNAMSEIAKGINVIADATSSVALSSEETTKKADIGKSSIQEAVTQMELIKTNVEETSKSIQTLDQRSKEIEDIVVAITDISAQTNLLALNAAIEAARAGEHGKGFAVVADEVRKLAEESTRSANQITELIQSIQSDTGMTVVKMTSVSKNVQEGVEVILRTGQAFKEIVDSAQTVASQIQEASAVSEQLAASTEEVSASFEEVNGITQIATSRTQTVAGLAEEQSAAMQEINASAETLRSLADELSKELNRFSF